MHNAESSPQPPLPGTRPQPKGLFIDRWGTLLELPEAGFVRSFAEARLIEGAVDALYRAHRAGWNLYLLGNEDAVGRGLLSENDWHRFEGDLLDALAGQGALVTRSYACLDHVPVDVEGGQHSVYLLPNTGAMYHAAHTDGVELRRSWVIGDGTLELVAGWRAGCHVAGVRTGLGVADGTLHVEPEFVSDSLGDAVMDVVQGAGVVEA